MVKEGGAGEQELGHRWGQAPAAGSSSPAPRRPAQPPPVLGDQWAPRGRNARGLQAGVIACTRPGPLPYAAGLRAARDPAGRAATACIPGDRSPPARARGSCAGRDGGLPTHRPCSAPQPRSRGGQAGRALLRSIRAPASSGRGAKRLAGWGKEEGRGGARAASPSSGPCRLLATTPRPAELRSAP